MRKSLSLLLVLCLIISSFSIAFAQPYIKLDIADKGVNLGHSISEDPRLAGKNDSDWVRVIVEMREEPVIDQAIDQGVKLDQLSQAAVDQTVIALKEQHDQVKDELASTYSMVEYHGDFYQVVNGFSATMTVGKAKEVEKMEGVKRVVVSTQYFLPEQPDMNSSSMITNHEMTWDLGYKGEGMVVAVLDTGVDPSHKDMMYLTNPDNAKIQDLNDFDLPGTYRNEKVPYGYNYMDNNQEILDLGPEASMHGMHVAGTVGANGDDDGIKGVAPEAQILAMKVFGNDAEINTTYSDVYVRAIEDSLILGADVINMSLGSTAEFLYSEEEDPARIAIRKAAESGVIVSISAGNSNRLGTGYTDWINSAYPDSGVVGSPSLNPESLSVASIENIYFDAPTLITSSTTAGAIAYVAAGSVDPVDYYDGPTAYVYCGLGGSADEFPAEVAGKIALISRGVHPFVTKISNAVDAGAIGVIVFNNAAGSLINMATPDGLSIPAIFISQDDGATLMSLLDTDDATVEFTGETTQLLNPNAGLMSTFSSWGMTPSLDFKPEITAPGGQIYSTLQNNSYGMMSGTSMAAPHVSGGSALVLEYIDETLGLTGYERYKFAKNLLMSTAKPHIQPIIEQLPNYQSYVSPRKQGAGVMDLYAATTSGAIVVNPDTNETKVNLKEIGNLSSFQVTIDNFAGGETTYRISVPVLTEISSNGENWPTSNEVSTSDGSPVYDVQLNGESVSEVTVTTGGSVTLDVTINLEDAIDWWNGAPLNDVYANGTFVDGFVIFDDVNDDAPQLSIPFVGFYGDWDQAPIMDVDIYSIDEANGVIPFYADEVTTTMTWRTTDGYSFLGNTSEGYSYDAIAFSPDGDGVADTAMPIITFLRNAKYLEINILDEDKNVVRKLATDTDIRKNYHDYRYPMYTAYEHWQWDGKINNQLMTTGDYYYQVKAKIDYPGAEWQTTEFPIYIDVVDPVFTAPIAYDADTNTLSVSAQDETAPEVQYLLFVDGEHAESNYTGQFTIDSEDILRVQVRAIDYALNEVASDVLVINADEDLTVPYVHLKNPEPFSTYNVSTIAFNGYVTEESTLKSFTIDGEEIATTLNTDTNAYDFGFEKTYDTDGVKTIQVAATDSNDQSIAFERTIYVDTTAPEISISKAKKQTVRVPAKSTEYNLKGTVSDNFPSLVVSIDGDEVYKHVVDPTADDIQDKAIVYQIDEIIALTSDSTTVVIEAQDYADNITTYELTIVRKGKPSSSGGSSSGGSSGGTTTVTTPDQTKTELPKEVQEKMETKAQEKAMKMASKVKKAKAKEKVALEVPTDAKYPNQYALYFFNEETGEWDYVGGKIEDGNMSTLAGAEGNYALMLYEKDFNDVNESISWADEAISVLSSRRIVNGKSDDSFAPNDKVNNEEFATLLFRAFDLEPQSGSGVDGASDWSQEAVDTLAALGVIDAAQTFGAQEDMTREDMAAMIVGVLQAVNYELPEPQAVLFGDADQMSEANKDAISIAHQLGIINGYGSNFGPQDNATRAQAVTMLYRLLKHADKL